MNWFFESAADVPEMLFSSLVLCAILILYTRMSGLRSFSKISSFDFAITVAIGSVLGTSVLTQNPPVFQAAIVLGSLFLFQFLVSYLRSRYRSVGKLVDNEPIVLMTRDGFIVENLKKSRIEKDEIRAKLRAANVLQLSEVKLVILETTGDISVLHSSDNTTIDPEIIEDVQDIHLTGGG